jgi:adenine-specific DNA-methyltransferase
MTHQRFPGRWRDRVFDEVFIGEGRVYGGGLHKFESRELDNAITEKILEVLPKMSVSELSA